MFPVRRNRRVGAQRRGVAAVEAAICTGIVVLLTFGTLEICSAIYLKEGVTIAAFEGARVGVKRKSTRADAVAEAESILTARGITGGTVNVSPGDFSALSALDQVTVVVRAPVNQNSFFIGKYFSNKKMRGRAAMFREFDE